MEGLMAMGTAYVAILMPVLLIFVIFFFGSIMELFNESGFDYSISAMLNIIK